MSDKETVTVVFKLDIGLVGCERKVRREIPIEEIPDEPYKKDKLYETARFELEKYVDYHFDIKDERFD